MTSQLIINTKHGKYEALLDSGYFSLDVIDYFESFYRDIILLLITVIK